MRNGILACIERIRTPRRVMERPCGTCNGVGLLLAGVQAVHVEAHTCPGCGGRKSVMVAA